VNPLMLEGLLPDGQAVSREAAERHAILARIEADIIIHEPADAVSVDPMGA
jgi:hypothetical protein